MKTITVLVATLILLNVGAQAQTAAAWNFTGSSVAPNTMGAGLTASSVSLGSDVNPTTSGFSGSDYFGQDGWPASATIDPNAFLQFDISPNSGYYLVLNTFSINLRHSTLGTGAGSGPTSFIVASSLDGYTSVLASGTLTNAYQTFTVTLPAAYQALMSDVTFRIYGYNTVMTSGGSNRLVTNGIKLTGQSNPGTLATQSIALSAAAAGQDVQLQWQTEGLEQGASLELQRATDGVHFVMLKQVTGSVASDDNVTPGQLYYRIEVRNPDGSSYFSPVVTVMVTGVSSTTDGIKGVTAQGSTVRSFLHLDNAGTYEVSIRTANGQAVYRQEISGQTGDLTTDLSIPSMAHGVYVLTLAGNGMNASKEFFY